MGKINLALEAPPALLNHAFRSQQRPPQTLPHRGVLPKPGLALTLARQHLCLSQAVPLRAAPGHDSRQTPSPKSKTLQAAPSDEVSCQASASAPSDCPLTS